MAAPAVHVVGCNLPQLQTLKIIASYSDCILMVLWLQKNSKVLQAALIL